MEQHDRLSIPSCLERLCLRAALPAPYLANQEEARYLGSTDEYSWQQKANKEKGIEGAQIDLILDRRDQIINLCEMKYSLKAYDITPAYLQKLLDRREIFRQASNTSKALHLTFVTAAGIKKNPQEGMIQSEVGLDDLFGEKV